VTAVGRTKDGRATLRVHIQPRSSKNRWCGWHGDCVKLAVTAPPVDGKANKAVANFLAELFGVERGSVELISGQHSRSKVFSFASLDEDELRQRLAKLSD